MPIEECGEPLVDLREYPLLVTGEHPRVGRRCETQLHCREGAARRFLEADSSLPDGLRLLILECHRTVEYQTLLWETGVKKLREKHPDWPDERLVRQNAEFVAPPWETPPHSTGGAVDLTLVDASGRELEMGSTVNARVPLSHTRSEEIDEEAEENRRILLSAMGSAGFVNYPHEWWHFGYGDRYWAYATGRSAACYASV